MFGSESGIHGAIRDTLQANRNYQQALKDQLEKLQANVDKIEELLVSDVACRAMAHTDNHVRIP